MKRRGDLAVDTNRGRHQNVVIQHETQETGHHERVSATSSVCAVSVFLLCVTLSPYWRQRERGLFLLLLVY